MTDERADFIRQETEDAARDEQASKAKGPIDDDDQPFDLGEWDFGEDNEPIPPRGWLLGNLLCRQFLSAIFGDGAVGKTALIIAMALSLAADRNLIGEHVFLRCRVLLICFEDGKAELRRRLTAAMLHYGISKADIRGHLFIATVNRSDAKLAHSKNGEVTVGKLRDALDQSIVRRNADATFLDPLVKAHAVGENNNSEIDFVAEILGELSVKHDCSFCSPHHTRKGPAEPGNADIGRGAGSLKDAFRLCYTLTAISKEEADRFAIGAEERASLIRLDSARSTWCADRQTHDGSNSSVSRSATKPSSIPAVTRSRPSNTGTHPTSSRTSTIVPGMKFSLRSTRVCQTASSTATTAKPLSGQLGRSS